MSIFLFSESFPSCKAALEQNHMMESFYFIKNGNMHEPILVECKKNNSGFYVATFPHKPNERILVKGYEGCGSYIKSLDYSPNNMSDIAAYIENATSCRQYTKVECLGAVLHAHKSCGNPSSRSGSILNYWGGGPTDGSGGCACGITNSCHNSATKCNCDANHGTLTLTDEGYMTDKSVLPITQVRFGDNGGSSEYLYFTIWKLECTEK